MLDCYHGSLQICHENPNCDPLSLGKLIRGLQSYGLYPIPEPSAVNWSLQYLFIAVRSMDLSDFCREANIKAKRLLANMDTNDFDFHLRAELRGLLSKIEGGADGLEL